MTGEHSWPTRAGRFFKIGLTEKEMKMKLRVLSAMASVVLVTACATPGTYPPGAVELRRGVVEHITPVRIESSHHAGVGAVLGGIAGLGIGSLIGGGTGRDVAMVLGTVGGALAGNEAQKRYDPPVPGEQVVVRLSNGVLLSVTQPTESRLRPGQAVYVEGNGDSARVIPR